MAADFTEYNNINYDFIPEEKPDRASLYKRDTYVVDKDESLTQAEYLEARDQFVEEGRELIDYTFNYIYPVAASECGEENIHNLINMNENPGDLTINNINELKKIEENPAASALAGIVSDSVIFDNLAGFRETTNPYNMQPLLLNIEDLKFSSAGLRSIASSILSWRNISELSDSEKMRKIIEMLISNGMPVNTITNLIDGKCNYYLSMVQNVMIQRLNLTAGYANQALSIIPNAIYRAKREMLNPLYEWIVKLPPLQREANDFLNGVLDEAERVSDDGAKYVSNLLKLNKLQSSINERRNAVLAEYTKYFNIRDLLKQFYNKESSHEIQRSL